ncbi:MAG: alpha/beta hydrolase [Thermomicrobiales bacterium]|nr:alpha/beta hydrolase [Thermomicrobiales bacterium]
MEHWQAGFVEVPGGRIHYTRGGAGDPPLLLVHGATEDGQCFPRVADALRAHHTVVTPDARGHGQSDPPGPGWDYATQGDDLAAVIRALGLERPVVIGHSMGCGAALHLAARHPDLVRALVLEDPGPWWMPVADVAALMTYAESSRERNLSRLSQTQAEAERDIRARYPNWPPEEVATIATAKRRVHPAAFVVYAPDYWIDLDWAALLRRIACPVLLIHTDPASGGILSAEAAAEFAGQVPQTQVRYLPGATHSIRRDRFPEYLAAVQGFLTTLSS